MSGLIVLLGLVIGSLIGLLGGGGTILAVPALVYVIGRPLPEAIATSLLVVAVGSASGIIPRLRTKQVQWRIAGAMAIVGAPGTVAGTVASRHISDALLLTLFAGIMLLAAWRMLAARPVDTGSSERAVVNRWVRVIAVGAAVGFLTGFLGVGGGFLIVPALTLLVRLPISQAIATSVAVVGVNSAVALISHSIGTTIDMDIAVPLTISTAMASLVGGRYSARVPTRKLQLGFAWLLITVAAGLTVSSFI